MSKPLLAFACLGPVLGGVAAIFESNLTTLAWTLIALLWVFNTHRASKMGDLWRKAHDSYRESFYAANDSARAWRNYARTLETSRHLAGEDNPSQGGTE